MNLKEPHSENRDTAVFSTVKLLGALSVSEVVFSSWSCSWHVCKPLRLPLWCVLAPPAPDTNVSAGWRGEVQCHRDGVGARHSSCLLWSLFLYGKSENWCAAILVPYLLCFSADVPAARGFIPPRRGVCCTQLVPERKGKDKLQQFSSAAARLSQLPAGAKASLSWLFDAWPLCL